MSDNVIPLAPKSRQVLRSEARRALKAEAAKPPLEDMAAADPRIAKLLRARHMLFALVKEQGRLRIGRKVLDSVLTTDTVDIKVQEDGDLIVTLVAGR